MKNQLKPKYFALSLIFLSIMMVFLLSVSRTHGSTGFDLNEIQVWDALSATRIYSRTIGDSPVAR